MRPFINLILLVGCTVSFIPMGAGAADPPRKIDVKRLSKNIEDVVVPLPNEIFAALNKLDSVNWKAFVRNEQGDEFHRAPAHRPIPRDGHRRRLHRRAGGGRAEREGNRAARRESGQRNRGGELDHAARQGHHRSGRPAQLAGRAPGTRSVLRTACSRR